MNSSFLVIGHRGCTGLEPENTLRAVRRAIDLGCQMVEVDVHQLGGKLVVIHDVTVNRTTNGRGRLSSFTLEEVRQLDAGEGERIPMLEEVLDLCLGQVAVNIELKGAGCAELVAKMLAARAGDSVVVSSFDWEQLEKFRELNELTDIAVLIDRFSKLDESFALAAKLDAAAVNPSIKILSESLVEQAHQVGLMVYPFTVRTVSDLEKVRECGADGCFIDDPSMLGVWV